MGEGELADFLGARRMAAHARAVGDTAADKDRCVARAVTGAAVTFLLDRLFCRAVHFGADCLVRTGLTRAAASARCAAAIAADVFNAENRVIKRDLSGICPQVLTETFIRLYAPLA